MKDTRDRESTSPAEVVVALIASHVIAPIILLNYGVALRTLVSSSSLTPISYCPLPIFMAGLFFVPDALAAVTDLALALGTLLLLSPILSL